MTTPEDLAGLYRRTAPKIAVVLHARLRVPQPVLEDAVHDVFETLLRSPTSARTVLRLDEAGAFRYLLTACHRRVLREMRRRAGSERAIELALANALGGPTPDDDLARTVLVDKLKTAYAAVPSPYREVLDLVIFQQRAPGEAAKLLGRTPDAVYQQLHRGLARLRQAL